MPSFDFASTVSDLTTTALLHPTRRPLIGITGNWADDRLQLLPGYFRSIEAAGGIPVILPPRRTPDADLLSLIDRLDGILLSGGADLNPLFVDEEPVTALGGINTERDAYELALIRLAYNRGVPMLGICRGIQMLAAALGGTLHQDLRTALPDTQLLKHSQEASRGTATHYVTAETDSLIGQLLGERFAVNSFHHQAVATEGDKLRITARTTDGVVEAVESSEGRPIVGVQWHPECFLAEGDRSMLPLFDYLVREANTYRTVRDMQHRLLTLDSHCDTPMWFDKGVDFYRRDPQLLVDLPKMRDGDLDATIMVAYLPQGALDDASRQAATRQAHALLDEIAQRVAKHPEVVGLATSPEEIVRNKAAGRLSILRGIENGYALGTDLSLVETFARKGIVYITLCHNGDNDICDSARRSQQTHGGLSDFGRRVIGEMNRCGLMVDLSHAAETSFYQTLEVSRTPIVCSHSSARALCDHPRNLTDDQLRALAACGGVAQVTLYHGFLRLDETNDPATAQDAVQHLLHMIDVAGIDHVGIGTDFDGDGGIPGLADASELPHFTRMLLAEGLTEADLAKVWGGNFLRVMAQCQAERAW